MPNAIILIRIIKCQSYIVGTEIKTFHQKNSKYILRMRTRFLHNENNIIIIMYIDRFVINVLRHH